MEHEAWPSARFYHRIQLPRFKCVARHGHRARRIFRSFRSNRGGAFHVAKLRIKTADEEGLRFQRYYPTHVGGLRPRSQADRRLLYAVWHPIILRCSSCSDIVPRFFTQYHPLFPILDASLGPNDYYDSCPLLFWTIIVIGSRRYAEDPNVLEKSSQLLTQMAFSSMALRSS